jgi:CcmD family protein
VNRAAELGSGGTAELGNCKSGVALWAATSAATQGSKRSRTRRAASRIFVWLLAACLLALVADRPAQAQPPTTAAAQDEFVPVDKLPTAESLPATPLVLIAYAVAWLAVLVYLFSIWKRMGRVEREIADIARRVQQRSGG